jgi:hypothetical protein
MKHIFFLFICFTAFSQTKGIVVDESNNPVSYVSISIENEKEGTNAEEDGRFSIDAQKDKILIFSAIGFKEKKVKAELASKVILEKEAIQISEVSVEAAKKQNKKIIDDYSGISRIMTRETIGKYFAVASAIEKYPFLKEVTFYTSSKINGAKVKVRILATTSDGKPGEELTEAKIVSVKKGGHNTTVSFENENIRVPETGIFAVVEPLNIEENKYYEETKVKTIVGGKRKVKSVASYEPYFGLLPSAENNTWFFSRVWTQKGIYTIKDPNAYSNLLMKKYHEKYQQLAINIALTN